MKASARTAPINRRQFIRTCLNGAMLTLFPNLLHADVASPPGDTPGLAREIINRIGTREIGLDLRRMDAQGGEVFRVQINADALYPMASCFKAFLVLYYYWYIPRDLWLDAPGTPLHSVAVYSNNVQTGVLLDRVGQRLNYFGNAIQKFNDFGLYTLGLRNGLHSWNYPNTPTENRTDARFAPSESRVVDLRGGPVRIDNVYTAAELADFYARLIQPDPFPEFPAAREAVARTLRLLSIPAEVYESPFERSFAGGYTGKDGVLPSRDSAAGRVLNDAGILTIGGATYICAFMSAGESESVSISLLREVAGLLEAYESVSAAR